MPKKFICKSQQLNSEDVISAALFTLCLSFCCYSSASFSSSNDCPQVKALPDEAQAVVTEKPSASTIKSIEKALLLHSRGDTDRAIRYLAEKLEAEEHSVNRVELLKYSASLANSEKNRLIAVDNLSRLLKETAVSAGAKMIYKSALIKHLLILNQFSRIAELQNNNEEPIQNFDYFSVAYASFVTADYHTAHCALSYMDELYRNQAWHDLNIHSLLKMQDYSDATEAADAAKKKFTTDTKFIKLFDYVSRLENSGRSDSSAGSSGQTELLVLNHPVLLNLVVSGVNSTETIRKGILEDATCATFVITSEGKAREIVIDGGVTDKATQKVVNEIISQSTFYRPLGDEKFVSASEQRLCLRAGNGMIVAEI
ncbi:hypothetical protein HPT27_02520 [Permianibacter sp. IMCC34836]|uniref:hypothetical protein n=1 Tax=Permianibacter fluminis TaxID=2738515 RepID=UPI001556E6EC|nr:hypothetical protein [Permianibacter fluminis]NQD35879.1 hypothetical protein [Permianibacter fluminis]